MFRLDVMNTKVTEQWSTITIAVYCFIPGQCSPRFFASNICTIEGWNLHLAQDVFSDSLQVGQQANFEKEMKKKEAEEEK